MRAEPVHVLYRRGYGVGMGATYRQFCPVAKAMELLDERWTMLVIRELAAGGERFNDLRRGLPRMSPTLLSKRLSRLQHAGLLIRDGERYQLTDAGRELRPIIESIGAWGIRWMGELGDRDLDPKLLLWDMRRNVVHEALPAGRTVIEFHFRGAVTGRRQWWLVMTSDDADVCDSDPGFPVRLVVAAELRTIVQIWLGQTSWQASVDSGQLRVDGPPSLQRALPGWFRLSAFAAVPRIDVTQAS